MVLAEDVFAGLLDDPPGPAWTSRGGSVDDEPTDLVPPVDDTDDTEGTEVAEGTAETAMGDPGSAASPTAVGACRWDRDRARADGGDLR